MYKIKDFLYMDVYSTDGKKYGFIKDVIVDMNGNTIKGFEISSNKLFNKKSLVLCEDIITFSNNMVANKISFGNYLSFCEVKNIDALDISGNIIGIISDIIFDMDSLNIRAVVISTGIFKDIICGKKILLPEETILGENSLLYLSNKKSIELVSNTHRLYLEDEEKNEK